MTSNEAMMPLLAQTFIDSKTGIQFNAVPSASKPSPNRSPPLRRKVDAIADPTKQDILSLSDEVLASKYSFGQEVGFGNWGSVWRCTRKGQDPSSDRMGGTVSIKLVHRSKNPTSSARVRSLWQEYKCIRALRDSPHPNIIIFHSFIITPSYALVVMDFHPRCIPVALPESVACHYFHGLVSAVDYLHAHGYTHNDIKPANILLSAEDEPKLIDFGFAQSHPASAGVHRFISSLSWGTPEYLDPSRAKGLPHDERLSDIFALGVTMYEVVVGRTPFEQDETEEFLTRDALELYYRRTLTGEFFGEHKISTEFAALIHLMVEPDARKRLKRCGQALSHPFFNPASSTPVRSSKKVATPKRTPKRDENSPIKVYRDNSTPTGAQPSPSSSGFSPRPLVLGDRAGGVNTPSRNVTPSKALSPTKTPPRSRIPVRKVDISTPTALSPTVPSKTKLPSKHYLKRVPAPRPATPPPVPRFRPAEADDDDSEEILAPSGGLSPRIDSSSSDARSSSSPTTTNSGASSPVTATFHESAQPELRPGDGVVESTFPSSERWEFAGLNGRTSPALIDNKPSSGSLTSKLRKMSVRKATPSFFGRRPRAVTLSSRPVHSLHDDRDAVTMPIELSSKSPEDLEAEKARLESFSRHIQALIARKASQPPIPRRSVAPKLDETITDMSILSATEVLQFRAQVARELAQESKSQSPEPLKPRPLRAISVSRRAGATTSHSEKPSARIRPSLAPSFVGQSSPASPASPTQEQEPIFKRGHRRIPTAIRDVPPIFLTETESESESDYRADTPCSERPLSPPFQLQEGRILPTWVPRSVESSSDHSDDDGDLDEPTVTIRTPPRVRKPSKHSPRKTPTQTLPRKSPPRAEPSAETLNDQYTHSTKPKLESPYMTEPVKFDSVDRDADDPKRSHSRASTWASVKSHSRSRSVLSFIFSGSSSRASTPSMSVETFSAADTTDDEAAAPRKKGGKWRRLKKLLK